MSEMSMADLSRAYRLLHAVAARGGAYSDSETAELVSDAASGNLILLESVTTFERALSTAERALECDNDDKLAEALVHLRISAMGVATDFDNLVDAISNLFQRRSVRQK